MLKTITISLLFLFFISTSSFAGEYFVGVGVAYPFHSNRGHTTHTEAMNLQFTQYFETSSWGSIGIREIIWDFFSLPGEGGIAGGIGPIGELHYSLHDDVLMFVTASGSIGGSNLSGKVPEVAGTLQFGGQLGVGLELAQMVRIEFQYQHLSNGGTAYPNAGLDMFTPMMVWKF